MKVGLAPAAERWRYRFLLGLAVALLLLQPVLQGGALGEAALAALLAATVAATGLVTRSASVARPLKLATPLLWLALHLLAKLTGAPLVGGLAFAASLWLVAQTVWLTVEALVRERKADGDALAGAIFGYFMLALTWSHLYAAALLLDPGAISVPGDAPLGSDLVYFSLVTVTTLGYGDVLPVSPLARILAATEAVIGALYIAVLIGRIVSDLKPGTPPPGDA
ncbi:potassium channel family protein [Albimonas sp. CAU 1670]|uniref:potassium channel family protein n=1 Tax=Albimonas sp. CAU 1670 TaxID=3032599 RepID=UPI0023DB0196|nr:potassium channel family protein [Albimonas sp. CAU 1670]MDF2231552.1 potassium channel family protein [Albimonas sp. CAU 1670]